MAKPSLPASKQALFNVNHVLIMDVIVQRHAFFLYLSVGVTSVAEDASTRALSRYTTAGSQRLHHGHASLEAYLPRLLHLPIDVKHRGATDEQRISPIEFDVIRRVR